MSKVGGLESVDDAYFAKMAGGKGKKGEEQFFEEAQVRGRCCFCV